MLDAQLNVGKALVVAQHHVEARFVRLDEIVFEQQRLGLGVGHRDFDRVDLCRERLHLGMDVAGGKVGSDPVFEAARLAHVQQLARGAEHAVHARTPGE